MSRNHFAVVEMELCNDVNDLTNEYILLAVARIRNGTHTFGIAVEGRFSDRAFFDPASLAALVARAPPHLEFRSGTAESCPEIAEC
jgi:hypothetical protein